MPSRFQSVIKIAALLACGFAGTAWGQTAQNISSYTSTADKDCRKLSGGSADDDGGTRVCPGPAGLVVLVSEGDLRETVSAGRNAKAASNEPAAQARFGPFSSTTPIIEWRRTARDQSPFAIIQRWHLADIDDEDKDGRPRTKQVLVVTRLVPGAVCHVAYIDVKANPNPNDLAREAADTLARGFTCGTDKVKAVGTSGRAMELARPG
ncbi:hypothetical protein BH10PSE11_BH10PSE11_30680 [soil metagenome]